MRVFTLVFLASAMILGGCASTNEHSKVAASPAEETYVPLGTLIAKKGPARGESGSVDLQSFDNNRTMNSGVNNSGKN